MIATIDLVNICHSTELQKPLLLAMKRLRLALSGSPSRITAVLFVLFVVLFGGIEQECSCVDLAELGFGGGGAVTGLLRVAVARPPAVCTALLSCWAARRGIGLWF